MAYIHSIPHSDPTMPAHTPQMPHFLAPNAALIGNVRFGINCSVWFGAVLRADINAIELGDNCNIQDNCVLHVSQTFPCILGNNVSLGHQATAHACTIEDGVLLGMGCRVLDGAHIGSGCIIAAGCVVPMGMRVPPNHLVAGVPGRIIKELSADQRRDLATLAPRYVDVQQLYPDLLTASHA